MQKPIAAIVEDDQQVSKIVSVVLSSAGYQTEIYSSGQLALEQIPTLVPKLVILDLSLPGLPGDELLSSMRDDPKLADTKVIITTADVFAPRKFYDKVHSILLKPFDIDELFSLARGILCS